MYTNHDHTCSYSTPYTYKGWSGGLSIRFQKGSGEVKDMHAITRASHNFPEWGMAGSYVGVDSDNEISLNIW